MIGGMTNKNWFKYYEHKGHAYGQCYISPHATFMYINIPKNASSWTKPILLSSGFTVTEYVSNPHLIDTKLPLAVLRDPVERWISGISEYMFLYHNSARPDSLNSFTLDLIFDRVAFDDHTESQVYFLEGLDKKSGFYFLCDSQYRQKFSHFLNAHGVSKDVEQLEFQHQTRNCLIRSTWANYFKQILEDNKQYLNKLKSYYKKDYDLIESVTLYEIPNDPR